VTVEDVKARGYNLDIKNPPEAGEIDDLCHFRSWHRTDILTLLSDVRYRGHSRRHLLAASISHFDPTETSS